MCFAQIDEAPRKDLIVHGRNISYCLSERVNEICALEFKWAVLISIIACNITQIASMIFIIFAIDDIPIITLGDAIASFLEVEDSCTSSVALLTKSELEKGLGLQQAASKRPVRWRPRKIYSYQAASFGQWMALAIT